MAASRRNPLAAAGQLTGTLARAGGRAMRAGAAIAAIARRDGWRAALDKITRVARRHRHYRKWVELYDGALDEGARNALRGQVARLARQPRFSVVVPVYNTPATLLRAMIESVQRQSYPHWELCIADDASSAPHVAEVLAEYTAADARIRVVRRAANGHISEASNSALELASGEYIALLDHDDVLPPQALSVVTKYINANPEGRLFYSDEDKISEGGVRGTPYFKPDWDPALILQQNYFSHFGVFEAELVRAVGGFRKGLEGSQDHDLVLRCVRLAGDAAVVHIPHVLYHWRATAGSTAANVDEKPYAAQAAVQAVRDHLAAIGVDAVVNGPSSSVPFIQVDYALPQPAPQVELIVCASGLAQNVAARVAALLDRTGYPCARVSVIGQEVGAATLPADLTRHITFVETGDGEALADTIDRVIAESTQPYICVLHEGAQPLETEWLADLMRHVTQDGTALAGPMLLDSSGRVYAAGMVVAGNGLLVRAHAGLAQGDAGYFGQALLTHSVFALPCLCVVAAREALVAAGGVRAAALRFASTRSCVAMRLPESVGRAVVAPRVRLVVDQACAASFMADLPTTGDAQVVRDVPAFDPHYNRNLGFDERANTATFDVAFPPRIGRFE